MLGDVASARDEFALISMESRAFPEVIELEWTLHAAGENWSEAHRAAQRLMDVAPDRVFGWIHRAYALRRMPGGGLAQAWDALRPAHDRFPRHFLVAYNLACYAVQMGRLEEGGDWLELAMSLANRVNVREMALRDPDLEPIWGRLKEEADP